MDIERPSKLRTVGKTDKETAAAGAQRLSRASRSTRLAELVADLLAATGLVAPDQLALVRGRAGHGSLAQAIVDEGVASSAGIARSLAVRYQVALVDLRSDERRRGTPPSRFRCTCWNASSRFRTSWRAACCASPSPIPETCTASTSSGSRPATRSSSASRRVRTSSPSCAAWRAPPRPSAPAQCSRRPRTSFEDEEEETDDLEAEDGVSDAPLVRLVNSIIFQAAEDGASDVHFEPQEDALVVRFRVDGVLAEVQRIPRRMAPGVTTRLKVLAKLDIAERRKPQDGRISLTAAAAGRMLDIRVATLPTVEGEKVVMRLLDKSRRAPTLEELGLADDMRARLADIVARPTGALLVTGPTGSGKSTTLYAALTTINRPEVNIITVEDPVEYRLAGVNQVQINVRAGLTFASALRSILRSDPDVVMVGEIRDGETAKISIEAALTGHFVLSTLHTNDAPSTITRLNEMGVEPFLTGAAVTGVLAQRLARKLCPHCCEMYQPSVEELLQSRVASDVALASDGMAFYRKRGCPRCNQTGYKGRVGIYQLLTMTESIAALAVARAAARRSSGPRWTPGCGRSGTTGWRRSPAG